MEEVTVYNNTTEGAKLFDFEKAKVQTLTLEQLERTHKENNVYGQPLKGIYHYALLETVLGEAREAGYTPEVYDLFAAQNKDRNTPGVVLLPQVEQQYGERAVEAHILRRVFANIRLRDLDDDTYTTNLAVSFHQKGIQVGFGNMVKICHNQCMLGASQYAATYGGRGEGRGSGTSLTDIIETVRSWFINARHIVVREREKIERMKAIDIPAQQMYQIIGQLTAMRVATDTSHKEIRTNAVYPLNQSQITQLTEAMLLRYNRERHITVWDLYNGATELYKATAMDIPAMLPQNRAMSAFLDEQFSL